MECECGCDFDNGSKDRQVVSFLLKELVHDVDKNV